MRRLLKIFVKDLFGGENLPESNNRRFYPNKNIIRTHMDRTKSTIRYSLIDQECLNNKVEEWKRNDPLVKIFFRAKKRPQRDENGEELEGKKFLFVYQSAWQQRLLQRYGKEMIFLDATYRTTRYSLPLSFLVVKTNVDYQIVAIFVAEDETKATITEALEVVKSWSPKLAPEFAMTDYCNEEIESLEKVFPGCNVFLCNFHREQAWERWFNKKSNGCSGRKGDILPRLRRIARSKTKIGVIEAIDSLKASEFWEDEQYSKLRDYLSKYWLPIKERWCWAYRQDRLLVNCNTNNGVERQNESFKYSYLKRHKNTSLTGMLTILVEEFLNDKFESYTRNKSKVGLQI